MTETLKSLSVGEIGRVLGFSKTGKPYRRKLLSMGLTPGVLLSITRYAPMGDPIEIMVRGFKLTLRKSEAESVLIERQ